VHLQDKGIAVHLGGRGQNGHLQGLCSTLIFCIPPNVLRLLPSLFGLPDFLIYLVFVAESSDQKGPGRSYGTDGAGYSSPECRDGTQPLSRVWWFGCGWALKQG
jgi:hypothetical protein